VKRERERDSVGKALVKGNSSILSPVCLLGLEFYYGKRAYPRLILSEKRREIECYDVPKEEWINRIMKGK